MSNLNILVLAEPKDGLPIDASTIDSLRREGRVFTVAAGASPAFRARVTMLFQESVLRAK